METHSQVVSGKELLISPLNLAADYSCTSDFEWTNKSPKLKFYLHPNAFLSSELFGAYLSNKGTTYLKKVSWFYTHVVIEFVSIQGLCAIVWIKVIQVKLTLLQHYVGWDHLRKKRNINHLGVIHHTAAKGRGLSLMDEEGTVRFEKWYPNYTIFWKEQGIFRYLSLSSSLRLSLFQKCGCFSVLACKWPACFFKLLLAGCFVYVENVPKRRIPTFSNLFGVNGPTFKRSWKACTVE